MNSELDRSLAKELRDTLVTNCEIHLLREILVKYRKMGFSSERLSRLLHTLRIGATEEVEERILELMDIASGFCAPDLRL